MDQLPTIERNLVDSCPPRSRERSIFTVFELAAPERPPARCAAAWLPIRKVIETNNSKLNFIIFEPFAFSPCLCGALCLGGELNPGQESPQRHRGITESQRTL